MATDVNAAELVKIRQAASYFEPAGAFIAGGALTSAFTAQPINDVDLYFKSRDRFVEAVHQAYDDGLWCVAVTTRAVTFAHGNSILQLMHFDWFADAAAVFDAFDFTCCMAAFDCDEKAFVFDDRFLEHASQRRLSFHSGTRFPFGSLLRVLKYQARGYSIGKGDLLRIALRCHQTPLTSWVELKDAIGGQYGEKIALQSDGEFSVTAAIDAIAATDFIVPASGGEEMPGSAEALLAQVFAASDEKLAA